jgi:hypothetical protein
LRIDGDAKRMRADLDHAFAGKRFRVNNRDLIVVAIGGHDQRAIGATPDGDAPTSTLAAMVPVARSIF